MKFKKNYFLNYLKEVPIPLAIERTLECGLFSELEFKRPILDLGCGDGIFAYVLFDEKIDVGIDPNDKELKIAYKYGQYNELIRCFGHSIPKDSHSFNTIYSNSVLEHIPDIDSVFKEVHRVLSPDGIFYLTVPTNLFDNYSIGYQLLCLIGLNSMAEKYKIFFNRFWKHYHSYDKNKWNTLFRNNKFQVVYVQEYDTEIICILNDMLTPFSIFSFIEKKIFNKWFLFASMRRLYAPLLYKLFSGVFKDKNRNNNCGLVFFCLKKMV